MLKLQEIDQELAAKKQDEANRLHKLKELYKQLNVLKLELTALEQQPDVQVSCRNSHYITLPFERCSS